MVEFGMDLRESFGSWISDFGISSGMESGIGSVGKIQEVVGTVVEAWVS